MISVLAMLFTLFTIVRTKIIGHYSLLITRYSLPITRNTNTLSKGRNARGDKLLQHVAATTFMAWWCDKIWSLQHVAFKGVFACFFYSTELRIVLIRTICAVAVIMTIVYNGSIILRHENMLIRYLLDSNSVIYHWFAIGCQIRGDYKPV